MVYTSSHILRVWKEFLCIEKIESMVEILNDNEVIVSIDHNDTSLL